MVAVHDGCLRLPRTLNLGLKKSQPIYREQMTHLALHDAGVSHILDVGRTNNLRHDTLRRAAIFDVSVEVGSANAEVGLRRKLKVSWHSRSLFIRPARLAVFSLGES